MEAQDVVVEVLNKNVTNKIAIIIKPGPKGYGLLLKLRLLLYCMLREIFSTRKLIKHLNKHPKILKQLGFSKLPNRRSIDRWKKAVDYELQQVITIVGDSYLQLNESQWTVLDSTPLVDEDDSESTIGHNSQGEFLGFKLHMSCDEKEVPLRAKVTQAHVHDSQIAEELFAPTPLTGGDCAYDSNKLRDKAWEHGSVLITSRNPRRYGKENRREPLSMLKQIRYVIEQGNGYIKSQVMKYAWKLIKGLKAKAVFALSAVLAIQVLAIYNMVKWGYPSIRITGVRI